MIYKDIFQNIWKEVSDESMMRYYGFYRKYFLYQSIFLIILALLDSVY